MSAPAHWEADVVLADGGTAHLRPIRPDDSELLTAMHNRLSDRTVYFRFFRPYPNLSPSDVARFTQVDHVNRVALVAMIGDDMVGVARYDRMPDTDEAEVAFVIEDAHQGRGIGSVLLEHLAAAARERGIRRFVAEVLPDNRGMVRVFVDAGYSVTREFDADAIHVEFPITPTTESLAVMQAREQRAESQSIARLLSPRSVAVIGASRTPGRVGNVMLTHLLAGGFTGPVYPVHPEAQAIAGVRAWPSVLDVPDDVDLAVVCTPGGVVPEVVEQCARKGVRALVVVSDVPDVEAERSLVALARRQGMRVVGPESLGVLNTDPGVNLNATLAPVVPEQGRIGLFSQTGALGVAVLRELHRRGLGLSAFVSAGRRADVSGNDLLQYWETDAGTDLVLLHLETFGNPRKFTRLARRLGRTKPVVAVQGAQSPLVDDLFRQAGVVRVDSVRQLLDVAEVLAHQPLPAGLRVAVVGDSPPLARLAVDACERLGLTVVGSMEIPAGSSPQDYGAAVPADADALVLVHAPLLAPDDAEDVVRALAGAARGRTAVLVAPFAGSARAGLPVYAEPHTAVRALSRVAHYAQWRRRPRGEMPVLDVDPAVARQAVAAHGTGDLPPAAAAALLDSYGIDVIAAVPVGTADEAVTVAERIGWPVALKTVEPHLRHRVDLGGVRLDLGSAEELRTAHAAMVSRLGSPRAVVQKMVPSGVAVVVGAEQHAGFGPLVSFGVAGVATDLLGDRAFRIVPMTDLDAADLVRSVRALPLLTGWRGADPVDLGALERLLLRVSRLVDDVPELARLDLNPVVASASGLYVLGAEVTLAPPLTRLDTGPRRLRV